MTKSYPLVIDQIREFEGGPKPLWYLSRGHHPIPLFLAELKGVYGIEAYPSQVCNTYWRQLPDGSAMTVKHPGHGAVPVTVCDVEILPSELSHKCPVCHGQQGAHTPAGWRQCTRCEGIGRVTEAMYDAYQRGRALRNDRIQRNMSQREEAARLGISQVELNRREQGYSSAEVQEN